jgi:hypothetical protein
MPQKAQRCMSQSVVLKQLREWKHETLHGNLGGPTRYNNWLAECNEFATAAWSKVAWHSDMNVKNSAYDSSVRRRYRSVRPDAATMPRDCRDCPHGHGVPGEDVTGDHPEGSCAANHGHRILMHDVFRDLLADMLRQCGFKKIETEPKNWDYRLTNNAGEGADRKRPDIICHDPRSNTKYVIDVTIAWNLTTGGCTDYYTGKLAAAKEKWKRSDAGWGECLREHQDFADGWVFVPFGLEISGSLGPEAAAFYAMAKGWARQQHDPSLYHWAAPSFGQYWAQKFGTSLVRGRAGVGCAAAKRHRAEMFAKTAHGSMAPDGDATSEGAL